MDAADKYTKTAISLHWLIAFAVLVNVLLAITVDYFPHAWERPIIDFHKSVGITILGLILLRLVWRLTHRPPPMGDYIKPWEAKLAHAAHWVMYALIIAMPLSGWLSDSGWKGAPSHPMYLFWIVPWFRFGFVTSMDPAGRQYVHDLFGNIHTLISYAIYGVVGLHVLGALKHQFIDKHPALRRMWR